MNDTESNPSKSPWEVSLFIFVAAEALSLFALGLALMAKVVMMNDLADSFADDPLDLWVALAVAVLVFGRGHDRVNDWRAKAAKR